LCMGTPTQETLVLSHKSQWQEKGDRIPITTYVFLDKELTRTHSALSPSISLTLLAAPPFGVAFK